MEKHPFTINTIWDFNERQSFVKSFLFYTMLKLENPSVPVDVFDSNTLDVGSRRFIGDYIYPIKEAIQKVNKQFNENIKFPNGTSQSFKCFIEWLMMGLNIESITYDEIANGDGFYLSWVVDYKGVDFLKDRKDNIGVIVQIANGKKISIGFNIRNIAHQLMNIRREIYVGSITDFSEKRKFISSFLKFINYVPRVNLNNVTFLNLQNIKRHGPLPSYLGYCYSEFYEVIRELNKLKDQFKPKKSMLRNEGLQECSSFYVFLKAIQNTPLEERWHEAYNKWLSPVKYWNRYCGDFGMEPLKINVTRFIVNPPDVSYLVIKERSKIDSHKSFLRKDKYEFCESFNDYFKKTYPGCKFNGNLDEIWEWFINEEDYNDFIAANDFKIDIPRNFSFCCLERINNGTPPIISELVVDEKIDQIIKLALSKVVSCHGEHFDKFFNEITKKNYFEMMTNCVLTIEDHEKIANTIFNRIDEFTFDSVKKFWMHICNLHYSNTNSTRRIKIEIS